MYTCLPLAVYIPPMVVHTHPHWLYMSLYKCPSLAVYTSLACIHNPTDCKRHWRYTHQPLMVYIPSLPVFTSVTLKMYLSQVKVQIQVLFGITLVHVPQLALYTSLAVYTSPAGCVLFYHWMCRGPVLAEYMLLAVPHWLCTRSLLAVYTTPTACVHAPHWLYASLH